MGVTVTCTFCSLKTTDTHYMRGHIQQCHLGRFVGCPICQVPIMHIRAISSHVETAHGLVDQEAFVDFKKVMEREVKEIVAKGIPAPLFEAPGLLEEEYARMLTPEQVGVVMSYARKPTNIERVLASRRQYKRETSSTLLSSQEGAISQKSAMSASVAESVKQSPILFSSPDVSQPSTSSVIPVVKAEGNAGLTDTSQQQLLLAITEAFESRFKGLEFKFDALGNDVIKRFSGKALQRSSSTTVSDALVAENPPSKRHRSDSSSSVNVSEAVPNSVVYDHVGNDVLINGPIKLSELLKIPGMMQNVFSLAPRSDLIRVCANLSKQTMVVFNDAYEKGGKMYQYDEPWQIWVIFIAILLFVIY